MKSLIQELVYQLKSECEKENKRCHITIVDNDKSSHYKIIEYVSKRVMELYGVTIEDIRCWKKSREARNAKKMIVFLLINRLSIPVQDIANQLDMSHQIISYMSLNPRSVYKINNYENIVYKIENELKQELYL